MPELPEVESARRLLHRLGVGRTIVRAVVADDDKVVKGIPPKKLQAALQGSQILSTDRRGKHMWAVLGPSKHSLMLHYGMTGMLAAKGEGAANYRGENVDAASWPPRFWKIHFQLDDGAEIAFCDSRRFARVQYVADPLALPSIAALGWDPLTGMPGVGELTQALARQRRSMKAVLLDQSFLAGVGNWVADEVLYQARIHPEQRADALTEEQAARVHGAVQHICRTASDLNAESARLPATWLFHARWSKGRKERPEVEGEAIEHITVAGRTSAFVPRLQVLQDGDAGVEDALREPPKQEPRKRPEPGGKETKVKRQAATTPPPAARKRRGAG
ncbi:hypothetical protein ACKKBF_B16330 [Auxenochlorella protothecoides x Auxenochlorella symbiontica]